MSAAPSTTDSMGGHSIEFGSRLITIDFANVDELDGQAKHLLKGCTAILMLMATARNVHEDDLRHASTALGVCTSLAHAVLCEIDSIVAASPQGVE